MLNFDLVSILFSTSIPTSFNILVKMFLHLYHINSLLHLSIQKIHHELSVAIVYSTKISNTVKQVSIRKSSSVGINTMQALYKPVDEVMKETDRRKIFTQSRDMNVTNTGPLKYNITYKYT